MLRNYSAHVPMTAPEFITVAKVGSIAEGAAETFVVGDNVVAVFHCRGEYYAINDMCPHMGASLAAGHVEDGVVTCPWHAWRFKICDGTWCDNPRIKTDAFQVRVVGDEIQVASRRSKVEGQTSKVESQEMEHGSTKNDT